MMRAFLVLLLHSAQAETNLLATEHGIRAAVPKHSAAFLSIAEEPHEEEHSHEERKDGFMSELQIHQPQGSGTKDVTPFVLATWTAAVLSATIIFLVVLHLLFRYVIHKNWEPTKKLMRLSLPVGIGSFFAVLLDTVPTENRVLQQYNWVPAVITLAIVLEMGTLDRLVVKCVLRTLGTFMGAVQGVCICLLMRAAGDEAFKVHCGFMFFFIWLNATYQKKYADYSYTFLVATITIVTCTNGFMQAAGWWAFAGRFISVLIGIFLGVIATALVEFALNDLHHKGVDAFFDQTNSMLSKVLVYLDFAFIRLEINAGEPGQTFDFNGRTFHSDVVKQYCLDKRSTFGELEKVAKAYLDKSPLDDQIAQLLTATKTTWSDVCWARKVFYMKPLPDLTRLPHQLYVAHTQISALTHSGQIDRAFWPVFKDDIEALRVAILALESPLKGMLQYNLKDKEEIDKVVQITKTVVQKLKDCHSCIEKARQNFREELNHLAFEKMEKSDQLQAKWYYRSFLRSMDSVIWSIGQYAKNCWNLLGASEEEQTVANAFRGSFDAFFASEEADDKHTFTSKASKGP